jgi:hypothetical protein
MSVKLYIDCYEKEFFVAESLMAATWNGWAIPYFTKSQAVATWDKLSRLDSNGKYFYDDVADEFVYDFEGELFRYPSTRIIRRVGDKDCSYDGYSLGGQQWCWTVDDGEVEID